MVNTRGYIITHKNILHWSDIFYFKGSDNPLKSAVFFFLFIFYFFNFHRKSLFESIGLFCSFHVVRINDMSQLRIGKQSQNVFRWRNMIENMNSYCREYANLSKCDPFINYGFDYKGVLTIRSSFFSVSF